jgi:hypothetical protein
MPRVRRKDLPPALLHYLLDRIQQRQIDARQLELLARWLDTEEGDARPLRGNGTEANGTDQGSLARRGVRPREGWTHLRL